MARSQVGHALPDIQTSPRMALLYLENIAVLKGECKKSDCGEIASLAVNITVVSACSLFLRNRFNSQILKRKLILI